MQKTQKPTQNVRGEEQSWRTDITNFQTDYKAAVMKSM